MAAAAAAAAKAAEREQEDAYDDAEHADVALYPLRNLSVVELFLNGHLTSPVGGRAPRHRPRPGAERAKGAEVAADDVEDPAAAAHAEPYLVDVDAALRGGRGGAVEALLLAEDDPRLLPDPAYVRASAPRDDDDDYY